MSVEIERGIPIPPARSMHRKYPFRRMEVGESFAVPLEGREPVAVQRSLHGSANKAGVKIKTRTMGEEVRVWLVAEKGEDAA